MRKHNKVLKKKCYKKYDDEKILNKKYEVKKRNMIREWDLDLLTELEMNEIEENCSFYDFKKFM